MASSPVGSLRLVPGCGFPYPEPGVIQKGVKWVMTQGPWGSEIKTALHVSLDPHTAFTSGRDTKTQMSTDSRAPPNKPDFPHSELQSHLEVPRWRL